MKVAITYFSGTGNTKRVGEVFKSYLQNINYDVDMIDMTKNTERLKNYDLIIIGTSTHFKISRKEVHNFIEKYIHQEDNAKAKLITFATHSWDITFAHIILKNFLEERNFKVVGAKAFLLPNNFIAFHPNPKNDPKRVNDLYHNISIDVNKILNTYHKKQTLIEGKITFKTSVYKGMYKVFRPLIITRFPKAFLKIDETKCIKCELCVKLCPMKNIKLTDGKIKLSNNCSACARCMHNCPSNAYLFMNKPIEQYKLNQKPILEQINLTI